MSNPGGETESSPNSEIEICAADWISRQQFNTWNNTGRAELDAWLAESDNHAAAYWRLKAAWDRTNRLAALRGSEPMRSAPSTEGRLFAFLLKAVAALVVLAGIGSAALYLNTAPRGEVFSTGIGGRTSITLADGSRIDLNTDTVIRADVGSHARSVELLKGEAYFQIKHDAAHPFTVVAASHRITDLGTMFLVRAYPKTLEVTLVEGSARIESTDSANQHHSALLTPGDIVTATADTMNVSKATARDLANGLAWRRGALVFHNASLGEAVAEFNRYGGTKLIVADPAISRLTINGTFRVTGAEEFAGVAHEIFGLRIDHRESDIVLSR